jgi:thiol-disulfide isomerase/thioredoxin
MKTDARPANRTRNPVDLMAQGETQILTRTRTVNQILCKFKFLSLIAALALGLVSTSSAQDDLTIGSKAPKIDIEHWVQNGEGKFSKVESFEAGKVYIIEFWATWCGPCVQSMPHLVELQKQYGERGVQLISVSDEDLDTVDAFLERNVPPSLLQKLNLNSEDASGDAGPKTFRDLTKSYCLTTDPDGSVNEDYMQASGQMGIPTAFIVGKDGLIEWIGHPMEMDKPLAAVVDGTWDREGYKKILARRQQVEGEMMKIFGKYEEGDFEGALKGIDNVLMLIDDDEEMRAGLTMMKLQLTLETNPADATAIFKSMLPSLKDSQMLNEVAWSVVEAVEEGKDVPGDLIAVAREAAEKAVKLDPNNGAVLDTLAHLVYFQGDLDKAIEIQTKAAKLEPGVDEIESFLERLKKEKASKGK